MIDSVRASMDLLASVAAVQRQFIAAAKPHRSFHDALALLLDISESRTGFIGEVLQSADGDPYLEIRTESDPARVAFSQGFDKWDAAGGGELHHLNHLVEAVIRRGKVVISNSPHDELHRRGTFSIHPPPEAFLGLPIVGDASELIGMVGLADRPAGYDDHLVAQLETLCDALGVMIIVARRDRQRREAETALRASEARYRTFVDHATDALFLHDRRGRVVDVNRQAYESLGYEREELIGMFPSEFDPDVTPAVAARIESRLEAGETVAFDSRHRRKDGTTFPVEVRIRPFEMDGAQYGLSLARDITERKLAEEAIRVSENRLTEAQRLARIGSWNWDILNEHVTWSNELYRIWGVCRDDFALTLESIFSLIHPDDREPVHAVIERALQEHAPYVCEHRIIRPDGAMRTLQSRGAAVLDDSGRVVQLYGTAQDVTELKQVEQALRENEARLRTLLENLDNVAVQAYEPDGTITFWNRASEAFYGYTADEALGNDIVELLHGEESRPRERQLMANALRSGLQLPAKEVEVVRRDGSRITVFASRIVHTRPGKSAEFFCFDVDITDRKHAEEELAIRQAELLHASRLSTVGQMVAELSHEVAQPFSAIGNFAAASAQILESATDAQSARLREYVQAILRQNERCGAVLQRLRDFSRRAPTSRSHCEIDALARDSLDLISSELRRHGVRVQLDIAERLPSVWGNRIRLQQVIVNLLTNARDAIRDLHQSRRLIVVRARRDERHLILEVEDHGTGLSDDAAAHLFEPFFTTKESGMGIGLNLCHSIVKDHGGRIEALSRDAGGTTFRVALPISP